MESYFVLLIDFIYIDSSGKLYAITKFANFTYLIIILYGSIHQKIEALKKRHKKIFQPLGKELKLKTAKSCHFFIVKYYLIYV